jgi:ATP-dependent protease HslVU (ClpYQ) peptidase subunit
MTTIIGIQGEDYALVCSDSRISTIDSGGYTSQITTLKEHNNKVATNGRYLLGAAGDMRAINILHHVFVPPPPTPGLKTKKLDQFITSKFIPSLRVCFENQGYSIPESNEDKTHIAEQGSDILVVLNGTIYIVEGDYSWTSDSSGLYAMGTGSSYALGALQVLMGKKSPTLPQARAIALKAIAVAAKYDPYTGSPFHCFVQDNSEKEK